MRDCIHQSAIGTRKFNNVLTVICPTLSEALMNSQDRLYIVSMGSDKANLLVVVGGLIDSNPGFALGIQLQVSDVVVGTFRCFEADGIVSVEGSDNGLGIAGLFAAVYSGGGDFPGAEGVFVSWDKEVSSNVVALAIGGGGGEALGQEESGQGEEMLVSHGRGGLAVGWMSLFVP
jgi:hypothetical protein